MRDRATTQPVDQQPGNASPIRENCLNQPFYSSTVMRFPGIIAQPSSQVSSPGHGSPGQASSAE